MRLSHTCVKGIITKIIKWIKDGKDLEVFVTPPDKSKDGHMAAITGVYLLANGKYKFRIADDAKQGAVVQDDLDPDYFDYDPLTKLISRNSQVEGWSISRFYGESVVPEPASWATMLAGFCLCGVVIRRRTNEPTWSSAGIRALSSEMISFRD